MKTKSKLIVGVILLAIIFFIIGYFTGIRAHATYISNMGCEIVPKSEISKDYKDVGGNIDIEYYLEVSEDSIWVENVQSHRVYGGTYSQLDSLISVDNL